MRKLKQWLREETILTPEICLLAFTAGMAIGWIYKFVGAVIKLVN